MHLSELDRGKDRTRCVDKAWAVFPAVHE